MLNANQHGFVPGMTKAKSLTGLIRQVEKEKQERAQKDQRMQERQQTEDIPEDDLLEV